MDIQGPEQTSRQLERYLRNGNIDALQGLYEPEAVFADDDGAARGWPAIRAVHQSFLDAGLTLTLTDSFALEVDNIALVHWSWTVQRSDGSSIEGTSAEVLRRQTDGCWRFVIDNSDGSAVIGLL